MICKDCLHYEACKGTYMNVSEYKPITDFDGEHYADIYHCPDFADKAEWVHLLCKVGTQVFFLRDKNNIIETSVEKIIFKGKEGKGCYIKLECNAMYETSCQNIGKTVFFTRESAEKALEKRRKTNDL